MRSSTDDEKQNVLRCQFNFTVALIEKLVGRKLNLATDSALVKLQPKDSSTCVGIYVLARALNIQKTRD